MILNKIQEKIDYIIFLHTSISKGRDRLTRLWEERKAMDDDVLAVSQELDALIVEYQRIMTSIYKSRTRLRLVK
jgi:predicted  nucleic acid-binding Zn-ribbon protein